MELIILATSWIGFVYVLVWFVEAVTSRKISDLPDWVGALLAFVAFIIVMLFILSEAP